MTPQQIELVEESFRKVQPQAQQAAAAFYAKLFEMDPSLRPLFRGPIEEQGRMLMQVLGVAVSSLRRFDTLRPVLRDLGKRHAGYGVTDEHFQTVGSALLWTLEQGLGDDFTPDVRSAWTLVYTAVADEMRSSLPRAEAA